MERAMKAGLYARVSTHDQQTLPMQLSTMREYVGVMVPKKEICTLKLTV